MFQEDKFVPKSTIPYHGGPKISPYNINAFSTHEVMRIKDLITQGEFS